MATPGLKIDPKQKNILDAGYPLYEIDMNELPPRAEEINTTPALIRGVAARFLQLGCTVRGFDAYCQSTVLPGSGLSSSAAYEVLIGTGASHANLCAI